MDIWALTAVELKLALRAGDVSCVEVVEATLARVNEINPRANAIVDLLADEALESAREKDALPARHPHREAPLFGIPYTAKLNVDVAGRPTTNGVRAFQDNNATQNNPCIQNWVDGGAICIGRTNVPAFSARYFTDNDLYGRTLNPWNADITPGGSSGGAAVAVATGMGQLSHGNDRAGSIRLPAHQAGIVGIRPTIGKIPSFDGTARFEPTLGSQLTNVQGCFGRCVADVRLGLDGMSCSSNSDPWWVPAEKHAEPTSLRPRIAIATKWPDASIDDPVASTLDLIAGRLRGLGFDVSEDCIPNLNEAASLFWTLTASEDSGRLQSLVDQFGDQAVQQARRSTLNYARQISTMGEYVEAMQRRSTMLREALHFLSTKPIFIAPVLLSKQVKVDTDQQGDEAVADMLDAYRPLTSISLLGLPSLTVPCCTIGGLPYGIQIVGSRFQEDLCLQVGQVIEREFGTFTPISPIWPQ